MDSSVLLNFFGVNLLINTRQVIVDRIRYIFRYYVNEVNNPPPDLFFRLDILPDEKGGSDSLFLNSVITNSNTNIHYSYDDVNFSQWKFEDTFLPPLQVEPLKGNYLVLHGCSVKLNGVTYLFVAPSFSGKTSLVLYLLDNGFKCVSDDLIFVENCNVTPYKKPVGFRETGLDVIPGMSEIAQRIIDDTTLCFTSTEGKKTWLLHLDDVFGDDVYVKDASRIDYVMFIDKNSSGKMRKLGTYEAYTDLMCAVCNSGIQKANVSKQVLNILKESKGYYHLPTLDMALALEELVSLK